MKMTREKDKREESRFSSLGKLFVLKKVKEKKKISPADWVLFQPQVDKHTNFVNQVTSCFTFPHSHSHRHPRPHSVAKKKTRSLQKKKEKLVVIPSMVMPSLPPSYSPRAEGAAANLLGTWVHSTSTEVFSLSSLHGD